jgi:hypothetical protein
MSSQPARDRENNTFNRFSSTVPDSIKKILRALIIKSGFEPHKNIIFHSPLRERGWFESYSGLPVNQNGDPIPWMPYCFIDFLSDRIQPHFRLFEYGSGGSTTWFANRVDEVVSVEHDPEWYDRMVSSVPSNVQLIHQNESEYVSSISNQGEFDVILIDGINRNECADIAPDYLTNKGVIILDDTYRSEYEPTRESLKSQGFKELALQGMGPVTLNTQRTSVFYRDNNCFGI